MSKNKLYKSFIGAGYYDTKVPSVILRNIIENPGWYTPYTPYQAEIAQGRLEMLLNFQTMISDLTGLPVANASLLDEATAAGEAAVMVFNLSNKKKDRFVVLDDCHPQTIDVVKTRIESLGAKVDVVPKDCLNISDDVCGVLVQYPNTYGHLDFYKDLADDIHSKGGYLVAATDLLALTILKPPSDFGADVVVGTAQRFGVPLGYGGPHAGFLSTSEEHKRKIPGRLIGVSKDSRGKRALRMAMQTREQHIRRDRATSNICTAQALLANVSAAYAIYHGPKGLKDIALRTHGMARILEKGFKLLGFQLKSSNFFDTICVALPENLSADDLFKYCEAEKITIRVIDSTLVSLSTDEETNLEHIDAVFRAFSKAMGKELVFTAKELSFSMDLDALLPIELQRSSEFLTHPIFNMYHSETELMRYLFSLQSKDLSLQTAMIPLGSCTMKLNAASEMIPVTWPETGKLHPFVPLHHAEGYTAMLKSLETMLADITGFHSISFQPNSGSQGEYAGLLCIRAYHESRGDSHRNVCLIPISAHGTNPASAVMAGMKVVVVKCDQDGNIDLEDLESLADKHRDNLSALMITYPSTHGVFEETVERACSIVHKFGGQVYMDGANLNAQVGFCSPGNIGADVCHLNLHKTFCIPHGGGGPGMGPIGVAEHLAPFLPGHKVVKTGGNKAIGAVSAAPFSSTSILPISWMYLKMMGAEGLKNATAAAILSANYMAKRLEKHYKILYRGSHGFVAHEFIVDLRPFKDIGITEEDVAKRLMDYNFHGPTMSWPVPGTLMIEPTESEPLHELDRFCDAMIKIREEISLVERGEVSATDSVLKGSPHTADMLLSSEWNRKYSRESAAYPLPYLRDNKFWPSVGRIDNVFGDRNVVCTCPPLSDYQ